MDFDDDIDRGEEDNYFKEFRWRRVEVQEVTTGHLEITYIMINNSLAKDSISLPNVMGKTLTKVIEYQEKHASSLTRSSKIGVGYINVDQASLYDILMRSTSFPSLSLFLQVDFLELCALFVIYI